MCSGEAEFLDVIGNWDKSYKSFSPVFGVMCSGDLLNPFFNASIYACSALPLLDKKEYSRESNPQPLDLHGVSLQNFLLMPHPS